MRKRKNINNEIKKAYADILFEKLDNACDLLEYYDNNEEISEFLRDAVKLFNAMHYIQEETEENNRKLLLTKLKNVQKETNRKIKEQGE